MCPDENTLALWVEGRLPADQAAAIGAHSEGCTDCRRVIVALTRLRSDRDPTEPEPAVTAPDEELSSGARLGRYVVEKKVGAGAMGVVYQAHDPALDRPVALKLLHPSSPGAAAEAHARLRREGQAVARLSHPNVVTVHDVGEHEGKSFVAMELIAGVTLREWLKQAPSVPERLKALLAAGEGLAAAHAASIVHRDFKPDNVLIDSAGRVVVTDFGLASEPEADAGRLSPGTRTHATQTGALLGTPAYMAPELLAGQRADQRSDQFSFCVTCHEVLGGVRPFAGEDLAQLKEAMRSGKVAPLPGTVPVQVRAALTRGLNAEPAGRFPSMRALLSQLQPRSRTQGWIPAAISVAVIAGILGAVLALRGEACSGRRERLAAVWNADRRDAIVASFRATGLSFADASSRALTLGLDRWAEQWGSAWRDACEANRVRGEQSDTLMDLRMRCLDARLTQVQALTAALARADESTVNASSGSLSRLEPLSDCADLEGLSAPVRPPTAEVQGQLAPLRQERAEISGLIAAAKYKEALARAEPLLGRAVALKYRPFEAEAGLLVAQARQSLEDYPGAETSFAAAVVAGEAGGHLALVGQAWARLIHLYAEPLAKLPLAHQASEHAEAALERLGAPAALEALVRRNQGELLYGENKFDEAFKRYERALALQQQGDEGSVQAASTINAMGNTRRQQGEGAKAVELHQRALAMLTQRLGEAHPDVALAMKNVGNDFWHDSKLEEALGWYRKVEQIQIAALGPDTLEVASTRNNVAAVLIRQQHLDEAETELKAVIAIREAKLGPEHPSLLGELNNLAVVYRYKEKFAEAEQSLRRALAIARKVHPEHEDVATTLINLGDIQLARHDFAASVDSYEQAAVLTERLVGPDNPNLADCFGGEAFPLIQLKRFPKALELTNRALGIYAKKPGIPLVEAQVQFAHAEAVWEVEKGQRNAARAEAVAARATMAKAGATPDDLKELDAWLKTHPL